MKIKNKVISSFLIYLSFLDNVENKEEKENNDENNKEDVHNESAEIAADQPIETPSEEPKQE